MKDELGDRMKSFYEDRTRYYLPRKSYYILRVDGKCFHTFTKGMKKPFDNTLDHCMDITTNALFEQIQGSYLTYTQSDEISILFSDLKNKETSLWFDGNIQKICSVASSIATSTFNHAAEKFKDVITKKANFDARVFSISNPIEVYNYFCWRMFDCSKNSIQMVARSLYSSKALEGKSCQDIINMLHNDHNIDWETYSTYHKFGRIGRHVSSILSDHKYYSLCDAWHFPSNPKPIQDIIFNIPQIDIA